jgi:hypothetical protein
MRRLLSLCLLTLALATVSLLFAAPLPQPRGTPPTPVENDGFALSITDEGRADQPFCPNRPLAHLKIRVDVHNRQAVRRGCPLDYRLVGWKGKNYWSMAATYIVWTPQGESYEFDLSGASPKHDRSPFKAPAIDPGKCVTGRLEDSDSGSSAPRDRQAIGKIGPKFCLTVVCGRLGLQSNTISIGGCPFPPAGYRPLDISEDTPKGEARREAIESERWRKHKMKQAEYEAELRRKFPDLPDGWMPAFSTSPLKR